MHRVQGDIAMMRQLLNTGAAPSLPGELSKFHLAPRAARPAGRPETGLEVLFRSWIDAGLPRGLGIIGLWAKRARYRREFSQLDARQMQDTGLEANFVRRESLKPFWAA
jgi:uncharacterized protein YjiS (DUF1127 family)